MKKLGLNILLAIFIMQLVAANVVAMESVPSSIISPRELTDWMSREFTYSMEMSDDWQKSEETLRSRTGDCEDFAIFVSKMLSRQSIENHMLIVKFRGLNIAHVICMWKNDDGSYSFTSNTKLYHSEKFEITEAITKYYPDWEKIVFTNENRTPIKIIRR